MSDSLHIKFGTYQLLATYPQLTFNKLKDQTEIDEQEGIMHISDGAVLGIRNLGGYSFPEGTEQRAVEYLSLLRLLAFRVQEAKKKQYKSL